MGPNEIQTALMSAVEEVLETMCFTGVLASGEGAVPRDEGDGAPAITASLCFRGSPSGGFRLRVPMSLARVVGAGFLGREEAEVSDSQADEVVCELANMICGSLLSRLESEATFQIGHPESTLSQTGAVSDPDSMCRWFDLGDGLLNASIQLHQAA